jgi:hypothetical protein
LLTEKYRQKEWAKLEFVLFYTTYLQKFLANNFSRHTFFKLLPQIYNQREILRFLNSHMQKKN